MRLTWVQPEDLLPHELVQSRAEGIDVDDIEHTWVAAGGDPVPPVSGAGPTPATPEVRILARTLLEKLQDRQSIAPERWEDVARLLPDVSPTPVDETMLSHRALGAWTGRAAGCLLGKPVEKIPRQGIEEILRATGRWPLDRWFTADGLPDDVASRWPWNRRSAPTSLEENIAGMPEDDDLNYPILALELLESHGRSFTTDNVAKLWLDNLPAGRVFTAERAAYRNLLDGRSAPESATHLNPFREWIGALIRTDVLGWTNPGDVLTAARLAYTDARLSHTSNGIYGAMWAAALGAAAMTCDTADEVLDLAQQVVPDRSELAAAIRLGRDIAGSTDLTEPGIRTALDTLHDTYGHLHWVHVLNNAAVIAYALAACGGDFGRGVSLAVTAGWDTDSASATVGAVLGALLGVDGIGPQWTEPLQGTIATSLPGGDQQISDLAARTVTLALEKTQ